MNLISLKHFFYFRLYECVTFQKTNVLDLRRSKCADNLFEFDIVVRCACITFPNSFKFLTDERRERRDLFFVLLTHPIGS